MLITSLKYLLHIRHCSMYWDTTVSKVDAKTPALVENIFWYSKKVLQADTQTSRLRQREQMGLGREHRGDRVRSWH